MTAFRLERVRHSIATNGHYFAGPVTFFALNPATYQFTYRFFANHTAENPEGYLDAQTLMTFQGVTKEGSNYKWSPGQERIPENVRHRLDFILLPTLILASVVPSVHWGRVHHSRLHGRSREYRIGEP